MPSKNISCSDRSLDCKAAFDGYWIGRGVLAGSTFTFDDGSSVPVHYFSRDELELTVDGETHRGKLRQDGQLHWDDGDVWRRDVTDAVSMRFGIRMHSHVRALHDKCAGIFVGEVGTVVGFTSECVEVKFARRIVRCSALDVAICDEGDTQNEERPAAISCSAARSETPLPPQVGCATHLPPSSSQVEVRTARKDTEDDVPRGKSGVARAWTDVLHQGPEGKASASRKVERFPLRQASRQAERQEVPKSRGVVRDGVSDQSLTISTSKCEKPPKGGSDSSMASRPKLVASMDATWYTGVVKWSRGSMAWLSCEELQARFPEQHVFLHKSECRAERMPRQMDRMVFRLAVADGNPKALEARTEASHLAAMSTSSSLMMSLGEYRASRCKHSR